MKKIIKFSKGFLPCWIISGLIIAFGVVGIITKGINFGIDFKPGLVEEVRIAPPAMELSYSGSATVSVNTSSTALEFVISGIGADNETRTFTYGQNPTINDMAAAINTIDGVKAAVLASGSSDSYGIYTNSAVSSTLTQTPMLIYVSTGATDVTVDAVRDSLTSYKGVDVKALGADSDPSFQIRVGVTGSSDSNKTLQDGITSALQSKFGSDNVALIKTDFVGSQFSQSLVGKSIWLVIATMVLIWLYATIRFHWDFALGAIIALFHDSMIMFTFIVWTRMEFTTTTLAAILTIVGYSINATVVILDRVRDNIKTMNTKSFNDILNKALSDTLGRSLITTITTMFASISLFVFTTGSIKDFALALTVGLVSGCYSSIFISSGFISFARRHWEPGENANRVRPKKTTAHNAVSTVSAAE
jgi:preprotein translocase subunit SecF